jgi:hypothetical protein
MRGKDPVFPTFRSSNSTMAVATETNLRKLILDPTRRQLFSCRGLPHLRARIGIPPYLTMLK